MLNSAIDAAWSVGLLESGIKLLVIDTTSETRTRTLVNKYWSRYVRSNASNSNHRIAFALDGSSASFIFQDAEYRERFAEVARVSSAVILGRATPLQKAQMAQFISLCFPNRPVTLAIGDGANDAAMLQEADIGIAVYDKRAEEAVRFSDFAIPEFRYLEQLLLVHGHWNYRRNAIVMLYSCYKNIANVAILFFFAGPSMFSAMNIYPSLLSSGWNIAFTSFPVILFGIFDMDLPAKWLLGFPETYQTGQRDEEMTTFAMSTWISSAIGHAIIVYMMVQYGFGYALDASGYPTDLNQLGTLMNGVILMVVSLRLLAESKNITLWNVGSIALSVLLWFIVVIITTDIGPLFSQ